MPFVSIQIIGRGRGVNGTAETPPDVWGLAGSVLPLPMDEELAVADLDPSPTDLTIAAGGIAFQNPTDAAQAYLALWKTSMAAKKAVQGGMSEVGDNPV